MDIYTNPPIPDVSCTIKETKAQDGTIQQHVTKVNEVGEAKTTVENYKVS